MTKRRILLLVCVLLTGIALAPWLRGPMQTRVGAGIEATAPQMQPDMNDPGPLQSYDEILRRPVFVATRRPAIAQKTIQAHSDAVRLLDRYPVVGVVIAGQQRMVLIRKSAGDTVSRIAQGEMLDGWTLTEISSGRLVLEMAGARKEVSLQNNGGSAD